jgi:Ca2+-binding RTX toxin-like protein
MLFKGTKGDDILAGTDINDTLQGNAGNDSLFAGDGDNLIIGGAGDDLLFNVDDDEVLLYDNGSTYSYSTLAGSDTLTGGKGQDGYFIELTTAGGSVIKEESANDDLVFIFTEIDDLDFIIDSPDATDFQSAIEELDLLRDPNNWGDAAIQLSRPQEGIIGLEKSGTSLIIDINRDGVAEASDDLTITNYFDDQGDLGKGAPSYINNIVNQQDIPLLSDSEFK